MAADSVGPRWTTLAALREQSRRAWSRGELLRELLAPTEAYPRRRTLKRPTAAELRDDYAAARLWASELQHGASGTVGYRLVTSDVGRNTVGTNRVPSAAVFDTVRDEIGFAGKGRDADRFERLAGDLAAAHPALGGWAARHPLRLLELGADARTAAAAALWFTAHPAPGIYLRQLSIPGVHTKFMETHRRTIDEMVLALDPARAHDARGAAGGPGGEPDDASVTARSPDNCESSAELDFAPRRRSFTERHGFLAPPELVRYRILDPSMSVLGGARDLTVTAEAFRALDPAVRTVLVTENLVNFLSLPERSGTLALFGAGYGFRMLRDAQWLRGCAVRYWGDLDTHGFRILDQLRSVHPHVESLMMDQETLLAHRAYWGKEPKPSRATLTRLSAAESALYTALGDGTFGPAVRLEQEHVQWDYALQRIQAANFPT
ncbi:MAG: DUF2220 family protein [Actinomycetota bacterium]|nr:DUF2220 family protein [Actinomycetota bacterium]